MSNWFTEQREQWISEAIEIYGFINREHVQQKFGISSAQASKDIQAVLRRPDSGIVYNFSTKRYETKPAATRSRKWDATITSQENLIEALDECESFLDRHTDMEIIEGRQIGNDALQLLSRLRYARESVGI